MPELPEVETIKRQLQKSIAGKKIKSADVKTPRFLDVCPTKFSKLVTGAKITRVWRRAKLLGIDLSNGYSLLIHLKMTGQLVYQLSCHPELDSGSHKHTHIIYHFTDGSRLIHNDIRKFGWVKITKSGDAGKYLEKQKYGPEPLERNFTLAVFKKILAQKPQQRAKQFLLDQKNIAGIGNIYADEILFSAGIMPTRKISTLTNNEIKKIHTGVKKILTEAIKYRGSSVDNYVDLQGRAGEYHIRLKAYGRAGRPCSKCKTPIKKIKFLGRGTHFCPKCQK